MANTFADDIKVTFLILNCNAWRAPCTGLSHTPCKMVTAKREIGSPNLGLSVHVDEVSVD